MLTEEQHQVRSKGIGGSEIAAIAGLNPWMTGLDVYLRKLKLTQQEESYHLQRGNFLEPALINWYEVETKARVERDVGTLVHPAYPIVRASPDGIAYTENDGYRRVLEIKSPSFRTADHWGEAGTDEIPDYYVPQVIWEMAVTELEQADVVALIGGELKIYTVTWDEELFFGLLAIAKDFWEDHIAVKIPPPIDGSNSARAWLKDRYPRGIRDMAEADWDASQLMFQLQAVRDNLTELKARKALLENELKEIIGDHQGLISEYAGKIYWKNNKDSAVTDWKELALDFQPTAAQIAAFTTTNPGPRVFRCYLKKED